MFHRWYGLYLRSRCLKDSPTCRCGRRVALNGLWASVPRIRRASAIASEAEDQLSEKDCTELRAETDRAVEVAAAKKPLSESCCAGQNPLRCCGP